MKKMKKIKQQPKESFVETNHIVLPSHANALGTIFGGVVMSWIDIVAAISAQRHAKQICVTASVDALHFLSPIHVGDTVTLRAQVVYTGRTSMIVEVEVTRQNPTQPTPQICVTSHLSMVSVNKSGKPVPVPELDLVTPHDKRAYKIAAERRKFLLNSLKAMQETPRNSKT